MTALATDLLTSAQTLAAGPLLDGAGEADRHARVAESSLAALRGAGLLGPLLTEPGRLRPLVDVAAALARGCGSTAMVWAMHQLQIACLLRHGGGSAWMADMLDRCEREQLLIASVTSEQGVNGDLRSSRASLDAVGPGRSALTKRATTISYGRCADAYLVTLRQSADAPPSDQVAVLVLRGQATLTDVGAWNPMGMRGTESPGCTISAVVHPDQMLAEPFDEVAAHTMVPLSHLLWSAVWLGLAREAAFRATSYLRARNQGNGGPPVADGRLVTAATVLRGIEDRLDRAVEAYEAVLGGAPITTGFAIRLNELKLAVSVDAVRVAEAALEICGMAGYAEEGRFSISRLLRDLYSARLMISNERIRATNAALLMLRRYG